MPRRRCYGCQTLELMLGINNATPDSQVFDHLKRRQAFEPTKPKELSSGLIKARTLWALTRRVRRRLPMRLKQIRRARLCLGAGKVIVGEEQIIQLRVYTVPGGRGNGWQGTQATRAVTEGVCSWRLPSILKEAFDLGCGMSASTYFVG